MNFADDMRANKKAAVAAAKSEKYAQMQSAPELCRRTGQARTGGRHCSASGANQEGLEAQYVRSRLAMLGSFVR